MTTNAINAVEMVRRIRDAHYAELRGASPEEWIAFYRDKARWLLDEVAVENQARLPGEAQAS